MQMTFKMADKMIILREILDTSQNAQFIGPLKFSEKKKKFIIDSNILFANNTRKSRVV